MNWREKLDPELKQYIDELIMKTSFYPEFKKASNPSKAQLWVALGILAKKSYEQDLRLKLAEQVLRDISPRKAEKLRSEEEKKKTREEIDRIMRELARGKPVVTAKTLNVPKPPVSVILPKIEKKPRAKIKGKNKEIEELKKVIKRNF